MKHQIGTKGLSSKEVAFLAEQEPIYILPRYTMNGTSLIGSNMPKLRALQRTEVALWLAVLLKRQNKCNIVIPDWLSLPYLKAKFKEEEHRKDRVTELPWHWIPTSKILLDICQDDFIDSPHELKSVIQDLREIRVLKIRQSFGMIDDEYMEMTGLSLMEINDVRPFLLKTMDMLRDLKKVTIDEEGEEEEEGEREGEREGDDEENMSSYRNEENGVFGNGDSISLDRNEGDYDSNHYMTEDIGIDSSFHDGGANHSILNTSALGTDSTLVEDHAAVTRPSTKRRRVDRASNSNTDSNNNINNNNNDINSDSDSDIEYRG
ncbi:DNA replication protein psf2 [Pichia californica]|nr:DNA replication protein psf2 [[Candida] californica]